MTAYFHGKNVNFKNLILIFRRLFAITIFSITNLSNFDLFSVNFYFYFLWFSIAVEIYIFKLFSIHKFSIKYTSSKPCLPKLNLNTVYCTSLYI